VALQPLQHYVHITNDEREGFVEFNFSINDPSLFLEMILPRGAFDDFCQLRNVTFLSPEQVQAVEKQHRIWRDEDVTDISLVQDNQ
jgi:phenol/toluene 2-monooxygenase (NADH) P0/A0